MIEFGGFNEYDTDALIEAEKGIDLKFDSGEVITVLRAGGANKNYTRTLQRLMRPHQRKIENKTMSIDESDALMAKVYAQSVLIGWDGVVDAKGKAVEFTQGNAEALLMQKRDLFREIQSYANSLEAFRKDQLEEVAEDLGN